MKHLSDFVKLFPLRASNISWLFGAGTSVSAGLPTAYDLIWDFKRRIYCAEQGYPLYHFSNLSDFAIRRTIQSYFDGKGTCPPEDSPEEYSFYFEYAFPSPKSRREYLDLMLSGMQLTYGHKVIGTLMRHKLINLIFTTNFDRAYENSATEQFKNTDSWFYSDLDNADNGLKLFQSNKSPLIVKLHGDYLSEKLKNISSELQEQDKKLRHILTVSSLTKGLGVMGYSGRDESVMEALTAALNQPNPFPHGIFWFVRSGTTPLQLVSNFIVQAKNKGVEAQIIEIETFDTAWAEIIKGFDRLPKEDVDKLNENYFRVNNRPLPAKGKRLPLIRFNAIYIQQFPATARLFKCNAGNTKEISQLIESASSPLLCIRKNAGIVGFGPDKEFERVFKVYGDFQKDLYQIPEKTLHYDDSSVKGLLTHALAKALSNGKPLLSVKRISRYVLIPDPKKIHLPVFNELKKEFTDKITGFVPNTKLAWIISLDINIQFKLQTAFLVLTPGILVAKSATGEGQGMIAPFVKELKARWYNDKFDRILSHWLNVLFDSTEITVKAFDSNDEGVNATFRLNKTTAHSFLI